MRILINGADTAIGTAVAKEAIRIARKTGAAAKLVLVSRAALSGEVANLKAEGAEVLMLQNNDDPATPAKLVKEAVSFCGGLDALASASLFVSSGSPLDMAVEDWDNSINRNIRENMLFAQAARESLAQSQGSIVFLCATTTQPVVGLGALTPAMMGLHMMTRSLADEWSKERIRVNGVALGLKAGPLAKATPEDVAGMFAFLMQQGTYITGQILSVDGGSGQASEPLTGKFELLEAARCA